jgi:hypothetical protein
MAKNHSWIIGFMLAVVLLLACCVPAASAASGTGLMRFMFVSDRYFEMVVELDGRELATLETNQLGDYIAIPADRGHALVLRARGLGLPDKVLHAYADYHAAAGTSGASASSGSTRAASTWVSRCAISAAFSRACPSTKGL